MDRSSLKENRIHGSFLLPFSYYEMNVCHRSNILDCHWHEELEFLLVKEGKALFQIETETFVVKKGEAIFISRDEIHAGFSIDNNPCSYSAFVFRSSFLNSENSDEIQTKYITPFIGGHFPLPRHIKSGEKWAEDVLEKLNNIFSILNEKLPTYELLIKASLYYVLSKMILACDKELQYTKQSENNYNIVRLKEVLNYIHDNYNRQITVKQLADCINLSEGHFSRFFKQMTKRTPIEYINYHRITMAVFLLENTRKRILDVSMEVGFNNFSYFINTFKKIMNCTPSEYMKK